MVSSIDTFCRNVFFFESEKVNRRLSLYKYKERLRGDTETERSRDGDKVRDQAYDHMII